MNQHAIKKAHSCSSIRAQYLRINHLTIFFAAPLTGLTAYFSYRADPFLSLFVTGVSGMCAYFLARVLIMHFAVGTSLIPKGPFIEEVGGRTDQDILEGEFLRLGGSGARKAASKLQDDIGNMSLTLDAPQAEVITRLKEFFMTDGVLLNTVPERSNYTVKGLIGCGIKQMNPALVTITLERHQNQIAAHIYGIAKEGLRKQLSGKEATVILTKLLKDEFEVSTDRA